MTKTSLIDFPCMFPVKIIAINSPTLIKEVRQLAQKYFPNFQADSLSHKLSKNNNYLAITATVYALNQAGLDAFYLEVTKNQDVKMVL